MSQRATTHGSGPDKAPSTAPARGVAPELEARAGTAGDRAVPAPTAGGEAPASGTNGVDHVSRLSPIVMSTLRAIAGRGADDELDDALQEAHLATEKLKGTVEGAAILGSGARTFEYMRTVGKRSLQRERQKARRGRATAEPLPEPSPENGWTEELIQLKRVLQPPMSAVTSVEELEAGRAGAVDAKFFPDSHTIGGCMGGLIDLARARILTDYYGWSDAAIAEAEGRSVGAVREAKRQARRRFKRLLRHLRRCQVQGPGCPVCERMRAHGVSIEAVERTIGASDRAIREELDKADEELRGSEG